MVDGYFINVRILLALYYDRQKDISKQIRNAVSLKALRNRDKMDVSTALELLSLPVRSALPEKPVVITVVPDPVLHKGHGPSQLSEPFDIQFHTCGLGFLTDCKRHRIYTAEMHCPVRVVKHIGSGAQGHVDGKSSESVFDVPCGLLVQKSRLLVADYNNSSIRIADISSLVSQKKSSQTDAEDLGDSDSDHDQASDSVGSGCNSAIDTSCLVRGVWVSSLKLIADGINGVSLLPQPLFLSESRNSNVVVVDNKLSSIFLLHTWRTMPAHAKHEKQLYQQQAMCRLLAHFPGSNLQGICFMKSNLMLCVADQRLCTVYVQNLARNYIKSATSLHHVVFVHHQSKMTAS